MLPSASKSQKVTFILMKCTKTVATIAAPFGPDMHQIVCRLGLRPRPTGELIALPRPHSWFREWDPREGEEGGEGKGGVVGIGTLHPRREGRWREWREGWGWGREGEREEISTHGLKLVASPMARRRYAKITNNGCQLDLLRSCVRFHQTRVTGDSEVYKLSFNRHSNSLRSTAFGFRQQCFSLRVTVVTTTYLNSQFRLQVCF